MKNHWNTYKWIAGFCLSILLLCSLPVEAAHLKGGYIEYSYLGPGLNNSSRYRITVYQYTDCNSTGGQIDNDINLAAYRVGSMLPEFSLIVPLEESKFLRKINFDCINNAPTVCYRIDSYSTIVDLLNSQTPVTITVQRCCRIANIANILSSNNAGITYMVNINTQNSSGIVLNNSSPVFEQKDTSLVCASNGFELPFEANDPDGDSLIFSFTSGLNTPSGEAKPLPPLPPPFPPINYQAQFFDKEPMGPNVRIDRFSGVISGIAPAESGDYVVAILVEEYRKGIKIGESRKELHISVGSCDIPSAILPASIINCDNYTIPFENQSTSSGIFSYNWDFGVPGRTDDTSALPSQSFTYPDTGVYRVKLVVNRFGKCPDSTFGEVRIFPGFTPDFKIDGVCQQLPYQFNDLTTARYGVVNKWKWDLGVAGVPSDISSLQNPAYRYAATGVYNTSLIVESSKGCIDTVAKVLTVSEKPDVRLAFRDTLICSIDTLQLRANGTGNYSWSPAADMLNSNTPTPLVFPKSTTVYKAFLNDRGCIATDSVRVRVLDFITVRIGNDTSICRTDSWQLNTQSEALSFKWSPAGIFDNPSVKNPVVTARDSITRIIVLANLGKCQDTDTLIIKTIPYPKAFAGNDSTICFGTLASLRGSGDGISATWSPATLLRGSQGYSTTAAPANTTTFILSIIDTRGCPKPSRDTVVITVRPRVTLFAGNDTSIVYNQLLQLNATSNASSVQWRPSIALSNAFVANPTALFTTLTLTAGIDSVKYTVTGTTPEGCNASDDIVVRVFKTGPSIFVPSGFTPNYDGLNDQLRPILAGMRGLTYFRVYNRYGQTVFETREQFKGWDGRLKGVLQASGTYVYQCQAVDFQGKIQSAKGSFLLIR